MEPGKREEKQLKETQTLQGKPSIKNLPHTAGVAEEGGTGKAAHGKQPQKKHPDKANPRRKEGEHRR